MEKMKEAKIRGCTMNLELVETSRTQLQSILLLSRKDWLKVVLVEKLQPKSQTSDIKKGQVTQICSKT